MAEKSVDNLLTSIENARRVTLPRFIASLSIPQVGEETAYDLAEHFHTFENLLNASYEELESLYGVGEVVAKSLVEWFKEKINQRMLDKLLKQVSIIEIVSSKPKNILGEKFRPYRNAFFTWPRRGEGKGKGAWRRCFGKRVFKDGLCGGRGKSRIKDGKSSRTRHKNPLGGGIFRNA